MATKKDFTKYINNLPKEQLVKELDKLYSKFKNVQEFYLMELAEDTSGILEKYKEALDKEYFPKTKMGYGKARASVANKIISDFAKIKVYDVDLIELMLYRVSLCIQYTDELGDITDQFYNSTENAFEAALKLIAKNNLEDEYKEECKEMIEVVSEMGWGFYSSLSNLYDEYFK